jgi:hypothetical protein
VARADDIDRHWGMGCTDVLLIVAAVPPARGAAPNTPTGLFCVLWENARICNLKAQTESADADAVPEHIRRQFIQVVRKYYFADARGPSPTEKLHAEREHGVASAPSRIETLPTHNGFRARSKWQARALRQRFRTYWTLMSAPSARTSKRSDGSGAAGFAAVTSGAEM